ncbi:MCE family protein (plasmid) [Mycolicibacterium psychrotolerans]|uniref:MCE family protein n=1 Tax=Mycolicibacterium psychrotolerans TaxID=216929 RepID=UPI003D66850A
MIGKHRARTVVTVLAIVSATGISACGWQGVNSLTLPGTEGGGAGSYQIQAQLPNVANIQPNSRVRVGDMTVGNVTKIERQDWHALVTMRLNGDVELPANCFAKLGQTSVFGTVHIELAPPPDVAPEGRLHNGSLIPLSHAGAYPTTEQTLAVASMLLNGGGLGRIQDITKAFSTAFAGREDDLRSLIHRLDEFIGHLDEQKDDIIAATESVNTLADQFARQQPVVDKALATIPDALVVLKDQRNALAEAFTRLGQFSALAADSAHQTKDALAQEFKNIAPVLESLANAGPALTRSLSLLTTFPFAKENVTKILRGDALNITMIIDMTLSRIDSSYFTGTRWEGGLTELEMQWGRTIGQLPSPVTGGNPLLAAYHLDQGP